MKIYKTFLKMSKDEYFLKLILSAIKVKNLVLED